MSPGTNTVGAFLPEKPFPSSDKYLHKTYPDAIWKEREFLASTDERFRPVNASMGSDGCLYLVDFHRGVIQHKRFLTSYLRRQSAERELDKHIGLGRIYRIVRRITKGLNRLRIRSPVFPIHTFGGAYVPKNKSLREIART